MITWGTLLSNIRLDLKDPPSDKPKWTDEMLYLFTCDAVRDYSKEVPLDKFRVVLTAQGGTYTIPSDFIVDNTVELEAGYYLEKAVDRPGIRVQTPTKATQYRLVGGKVYIEPSPADGSTILFSYGASHTTPDDASDSDGEISVAIQDEELLRLYVKAKAIEQFRTAQSNLDKFKPAGDRSDNPLFEEYDLLMKAYREKLAERSGGLIILYKPGRLK